MLRDCRLLPRLKDLTIRRAQKNVALARRGVICGEDALRSKPRCGDIDFLCRVVGVSTIHAGPQAGSKNEDHPWWMSVAKVAELPPLILPSWILPFLDCFAGLAHTSALRRGLLESNTRGAAAGVVSGISLADWACLGSTWSVDPSLSR